ncbi:MAG: DUF1559 domain-containing protein [Planctomycetota bacterium]
MAPINAEPGHVSLDWNAGGDCHDAGDRVRNFLGGHPQGAIFANGDGSVRTLTDTIDPQLFRVMGTIAD